MLRKQWSICTIGVAPSGDNRNEGQACWRQWSPWTAMFAHTRGHCFINAQHHFWMLEVSNSFTKAWILIRNVSADEGSLAWVMWSTSTLGKPNFSAVLLPNSGTAWGYQEICRHRFKWYWLWWWGTLHTTRGDLFKVLAVVVCGGNVKKLIGHAELTMLDNTPWVDGATKR